MSSAFRAGGLAAALMTVVTLLAPSPVAAASPLTPVVPVSTTWSLNTQPVVAPPVAPAVQPQPAPAEQSPLMIQPLPMASPAQPSASADRPQLSLNDLVLAFVNYGNHDAEQECLAGAVYFEARGEPLEGQLAVAQVVLNRAASGVYPRNICEVVTQPAQFSFVRRGKFPPINKASQAWHKAVAIADIARKNLVQKIASNVLWYHANYVAPAWGRRLTRVAQLGSHIFYN